jgi:hypothetical protein
MPKLDLQRLLGVQKNEIKAMNDAFDALVGVGYLSIDGGRLWITKFADAQAARSPGAKRQAAYKANKRQRETSPASSPPSVTADALGDASVTSQIDETRRDETRTPNPVVAEPALAERARAVLENPHDGQWQQPSKWPETIAVCEAWSFTTSTKLRDYPPGDSDLRAILEAFADGTTVDECLLAGKRAKVSEYFAGLKSKGPASFTAAVLRRLLGDQVAPAAPQVSLPAGVKLGAEGL